MVSHNIFAFRGFSCMWILTVVFVHTFLWNYDVWIYVYWLWYLLSSIVYNCLFSPLSRRVSTTWVFSGCVFPCVFPCVFALVCVTYSLCLFSMFSTHFGIACYAVFRLSVSARHLSCSVSSLSLVVFLLCAWLSFVLHSLCSFFIRLPRSSVLCGLSHRISRIVWTSPVLPQLYTHTYTDI